MGNYFNVITKETDGEITIFARFHKLRFWQELFIYFVVFSIAGHYLEIIWFFFQYLATDNPMRLPITPTMLVAIPYGLGIVAMLMLIIPLKEKYKLSPFAIFVLNIIITATVEYCCAAWLVFTEGFNKHWNYVNQPFNIDGFTSLSAGIVFGSLATFFIYFIYPVSNKLIKKLSNKQVFCIFTILAISYGLSLWVAE